MRVSPAYATLANAQPPPIQKLLASQDLSEAEAGQVFSDLAAGRLNEAEIGALLIALKIKGETTQELIGTAKALQAAALPFPRPDYLFADCCGTGGDGSSSINVSTATAFVAAAAGLPVAKHGNRSFTSLCGSADVLEELGATLDVPPAKARAILDEIGICFLYAPAYHPGLKHAGRSRSALKVRTILNLTGPCLNPARPPIQLLGVPDPALLEPIAKTLSALGVTQALVVHGSGLDEVALHGSTVAIRIADGKFKELVLSPEDAGLERQPIDLTKGGEPKENAARLLKLLEGNGSEAETNLVALNAGALLMTAGLARGFKSGVTLAFDAIRSGAPAQILKAFVSTTND